MNRCGLALVIALWSLGCGRGNSPMDLAVSDLALAPPLCADPVVPDGGPPPTFANVQKVFDGYCLFACHCCSGEVDLSAGRAWADLVNMAPPATATAGDLVCSGALVKPADPTHSYLYQKITQTMPCYGALMPLSEFGSTALPDCEIDLIRRWILAGAPND